MGAGFLVRGQWAATPGALRAAPPARKKVLWVLEVALVAPLCFNVHLELAFCLSNSCLPCFFPSAHILLAFRLREMSLKL